MEGSQQPSGTAQSSKQTTERIQALAEISKVYLPLDYPDPPLTVRQKIPQLIQHAGQAVNALTRNPLPEGSEASDEDGPLAKNKTVFKDNYAAFLTMLNEVTESLNKEADALVEAKLLPAHPPKKGILGDSITNEGLGNLDVGYLNSRTRDVGLAKEAELVKEMKDYIRKLLERQEQETKGDTMDES
jgi:hypothetical protein